MIRSTTASFFATFWLCAVLVCPVHGEQKNRLTEIRYWSAPTFTRIVFDLQQETRYESSKLADPERITLTMNNFDGFLPTSLLSINDGIVKNVRALQDRAGQVRVVIELDKPADHNIFPLRPIDGKGPRLVVDVTRDDLEQADRRQREETRRQKKKGDFVVVVDPGHGGEDPGAVSKRGVQEKDIVLAISRRLVEQLERMPGVKAYLTRKGDYFIPLNKRIDIAKEYGADAFVSVHVNAGFSPKVSGSSVYCLSFKGASSNAAKLAESRENASDGIGGVPLDRQGHGVNAILYDMVQTHTLNTSVRFAELLLGELSKINKLHTPSPQQANFAVLRSLDIPSVLIETDFISNPERERALSSTNFQNELAKTIAGAVRQYAGVAPAGQDATATIARTPAAPSPAPQPDQKVAAVSAQTNRMGAVAPASGIRNAAAVAKKAQPPKTPAAAPDPVPGYRIVKKSDTQYALVPVSADKKTDSPTGAPRPNGVQKKKEAAETHRVSVHIVQKGETFFSIARKYDVPVAELKKLNGLSEIPSLKIGERIKVPALTSRADAAADKNS